MVADRVIPDRWLLACSDAVYESIVGDWAEAAALESLLRWRLDSGQVEHVRLADLPDRLARAAAAAPAGTLRIVVEALGDAEVALLEPLAELGLDLRLHVWSEDALEVIDSLHAPEAAALENWRAWVDDGVLPTRYCDALRHWAATALEDHGAAAFNRLYPHLATRPLPALAAAVIQVVLHPVAANATNYQVQANAVRGGAESQPQGRTLEWVGTLDGDVGFVLVLRLPARAGSELAAQISAARPAGSHQVIEVRLSDQILLVLGPPIAWEAHNAGSYTLAFVPCPPALFDALQGPATPDLQLTLR